MLAPILRQWPDNHDSIYPAFRSTLSSVATTASPAFSMMLIDDPATYPWSSCARHCGLRQGAILSAHPACTALAPTPDARADAYRQLLHEALPDDDPQAIRTHLRQQRVLGRDDFRAMVEARTQRFAGVRPAHRPPHAKSNDCE